MARTIFYLEANLCYRRRPVRIKGQSAYMAQEGLIIYDEYVKRNVPGGGGLSLRNTFPVTWSVTGSLTCNWVRTPQGA